MDKSSKVKTGAGIKRKILSPDKTAPYVFLAPTILLFAFIFLFPILFILWVSMYRWNLLKPSDGITFVGFGNFLELFSSSSFWSALWVTAKFVFITVPVGMFLGLCIALLLNRKFPLKKIIQAIIIIPTMIVPTAAYLSWKFLLEPTFGVVNYLLSLLKIPGPGWFSDLNTALISVVIVDLWATVPFIFLVLYAGLQAVPNEPLEAAHADGANRWQKFLYVTIPYLKPVLLVMLVVRIMDAIRVFDNIYVLTKGGPANSTRTIQYECYHLAFNSFLAGKGSALALIIVVIILLVGLPMIRQINLLNEEIKQ